MARSTVTNPGSFTRAVKAGLAALGVSTAEIVKTPANQPPSALCTLVWAPMTAEQAAALAAWGGFTVERTGTARLGREFAQWQISGWQTANPAITPTMRIDVVAEPGDALHEPA